MAKSQVCISRKKAVELGLRKAPKAGAKTAPRVVIARTPEGREFKKALKELSRIKGKSTATCRDVSSASIRAMARARSIITAHREGMTRKSLSALNKRITGLERASNKFCKVVRKRADRAEAAAKRAASLRGRR